jgi:L-ribulokinase
MTFVRISTDDTSGRIRGYVGEGRFTDDPLETFGGAGVVEIRRDADRCSIDLRARLRASTLPPTEPDISGRLRSHSAISRLGNVPAPRLTMAVVAGVDFGTLSVRVSIVDSTKGRWAPGLPITRCIAALTIRTRPPRATPITCARWSTRRARRLAEAAVPGDAIAALAIDTTGSSIIPVGPNLEPLDDYYLWCDHRAWEEAALITATAERLDLEAIQWCGGTYSSEWGWAKLLHWLRHNPALRGRMATALEHCDMAAAVLCGVTDPAAVPRSICAMGHKWMYTKAACLRKSFSPRSIRCCWRARAHRGTYATAVASLERCRTNGPQSSDCAPASPSHRRIDAHWDAIGAGCRIGDVVNVVGTSTCIMAITDEPTLIPGVCGVVPGSIHPHKTGVEAGLAATGDIFDAIARRAGSTVAALAQGLESYFAGQTGLLRLTWDNGDRTVLVNPELSGATLGWRLTSTAQDELFAAIEGTAFHTRVILERMEEHGVPVRRIVNGGGIPQRNAVLNQVYANALGKPILVPDGDVTSLGSAIFAFLAAGTFRPWKRRRTRSVLAIARSSRRAPRSTLTGSFIRCTASYTSTFGGATVEYFLAQEYIIGRDVGKLLQRHMEVVGRPLSERLVLYIVHEVLEALAYAHNRTDAAGRPIGLVHRDISPGNVMVTARGEVKLFDFGIVKGEGRVSKTDVGVVKGNVFVHVAGSKRAGRRRRALRSVFARAGACTTV